MDSTGGGGEGAILQLQQEVARLRELFGRRSREIDLKMGELRSALHQANEKYRELEAVVGESRSLVSDSGVPGEEPEEESGSQADRDLRFASTKCANCIALEREVKELMSNPSDGGLRKEVPLEEVTVQETSAGKERASTSAGGTSKRHSESSEEEPPRKMRHALSGAPEEEEEDVNLADGDGWRPLHHAAFCGDVRKLRELVAGGADTRLRDLGGMTPLHMALFLNDVAVADLLADVDGGNDIEDSDGETPLHVAAVFGHMGAVQKLLAGGARTRVQDRWGATPLHLALSWGREAAAELLAEADGGIELRDGQGRTPLHHAAEKGFRRVVAILLQNDPNPHIRDDEGKYPIQLSLKGRRHDEVSKMILSSCALKDIALNWAELGLVPCALRFCIGVVSLCSEEIRLMKDVRVGPSRLSYHDLVRRHVSRVATRLPGVVRRDPRERDFPHYAERITLRLRSVEERRVRTERCRECFSLLPPELPPLPVTCTGIILLCLGDGDMENFNRAVQLPPRE